MLPSPGSPAFPLDWWLWHKPEDSTKCRLCRWSGKQKPPGDLLEISEAADEFAYGRHIFTWSKAWGLLHGPREVNVPNVRWNRNSQIDEAKNTADTVKGSESIYFSLLKMITHAWLSAVLHHSWVACSPFSSKSYLVHIEYMHSTCVQVWTDKVRY